MTEAPTAPPAAHPTITFHNREIAVLEPSTEQWALIVELNEWWRKNQRQVAGVADRLKTDDGGSAATPDQEVARNLARAATTRIARLQNLIGALLADPDDWDWIQDGMADRSIPWEDFTDLPARIGARYRGEEEPANRAERRAKGRGSRVR